AQGWAGVLCEPGHVPRSSSPHERLVSHVNRIAASYSLIAAALMALASPAVAVPAPGLDLAWSNCASQGGASNQNFACDDDFVLDLVINTSHTVAGPPGPCAGCTTPVCIVLNTVNVVPGTNPGTRIGAPSSGSSNQATWQGAGGAICAAVPVKNATWGQVKA